MSVSEQLSLQAFLSADGSIDRTVRSMPQLQRSRPKPKPRPKQQKLMAQPMLLSVEADKIAPVPPQPPESSEAQRPSAMNLQAARSVAPQKYDSAADPNYDPLKICYQCGSPIKTGGLDHFLCSGTCGYVVDRIWQQQQAEREAAKRLRRLKEPPQSATCTEQIDRSGESETIDLFTYGLEGGES